MFFFLSRKAKKSQLSSPLKIVRPAFFIILLSILVVACESIPSPAPEPSETVTPAVKTATATPTREEVANLEGERIILYHLCGQSGPNSEFNVSRILAARDMVNHINVEGGVFGAQIDLKLVDTGGDAEIALSAYKRIRRRDENILLILFCDADSEMALAGQLNQDALPALGPGIAATTIFRVEDSHLYSFNVEADRQFAHWLNYLVGHWKEIKPLGAGKEIRVVLISGPEEEGSVVSSPAAMAYAADLGVEIVDQLSVENSHNANLYDAVYASRDANSNVIYIQTRGEASVELLNALTALGLRERVIIAGPSHAFETSPLPYLLNPSNLSGTYVTASSLWWSDEEKSAIQLAREIFAANSHPEDARDVAYLSMLGAVDLIRRALEDAILSVGYENLDADALQAALAQLSDISVLDGLFIVNYNSNHHALDSLQIMVFGEDPTDLIRVQDFEPVPYLEIEVEE